MSPSSTKSEVDVFIGQASGRIDFMGGVANYSGSLVLERKKSVIGLNMF